MPPAVTRRTILGAAVGLAAYNVGPAHAASRKLRGNIVYRARIALPPNTRVTVELADISLADAPARIIGRTTFRPRGGSPISYEISYDTNLIHPRHTYALHARITRNGKLMFTNTTRHVVFDGGRPRTDVVVELVRP